MTGGKLTREGGQCPKLAERECKFADKYALQFPLLADTGHAVAEAYGVWKEKSLFGRKLHMNERTTYVIGADGRIAKVFPKVSPEQHVDRVLEAL